MTSLKSILLTILIINLLVTIYPVMALEISSDSLSKDFLKNKETARKKYLNKELTVYGNISSFDSHLNSNPTVIFSYKYPVKSIACYITDSEVAKLKQYKVGDEIGFKGYCTRTSPAYISIKNCQIIESGQAKEFLINVEKLKEKKKAAAGARTEWEEEQKRKQLENDRRHKELKMKQEKELELQRLKTEKEKERLGGETPYQLKTKFLGFPMGCSKKYAFGTTKDEYVLLKKEDKEEVYISKGSSRLNNVIKTELWFWNDCLFIVGVFFDHKTSANEKFIKALKIKIENKYFPLNSPILAERDGYTGSAEGLMITIFKPNRPDNKSLFLSCSHSRLITEKEEYELKKQAEKIGNF